MTQQRLLSDIVIDSALITAATASTALGLSVVSPAFFGIMVLTAIARKFIPRSEYDHLLTKIGFKPARINESLMGRQWSEYLALRSQALADKPSSIGGGLKRAWTVYGISLGAMAYWTMPFVIAAGGKLLAGHFALALMLLGLHHLSIFAQYAEIRAWAKKKQHRADRRTT